MCLIITILKRHSDYSVAISSRPPADPQSWMTPRFSASPEQVPEETGLPQFSDLNPLNPKFICK
jgi:hypothetical protein